jgi:hypothetical protein
VPETEIKNNIKALLEAGNRKEIHFIALENKKHNL